MDLVKQVNEETKEPSEKHVKEERDYFEYGVQCLKGLIEFVEKEDDDAESDRKKQYQQIATTSRVLIKELEKHIKSYE